MPTTPLLVLPALPPPVPVTTTAAIKAAHCYGEDSWKAHRDLLVDSPEMLKNKYLVEVSVHKGAPRRFAQVINPDLVMLDMGDGLELCISKVRWWQELSRGVTGPSITQESTDSLEVACVKEWGPLEEMMNIAEYANPPSLSSFCFISLPKDPAIPAEGTFHCGILLHRSANGRLPRRSARSANMV